MCAAASSLSGVVSKPILGEGREQRKKIVGDFLKGRRQSSLFQDVINGISKCRLAVREADESSPQGLFVYANRLSDKYAYLGLARGVEIQFFSGIPRDDQSFFSQTAPTMWSDLKELTNELAPKSFFISVQKTESLMIEFFKQKGFQTYQLNPSSPIILLGWSKPSIGEKRARDDDEKEPTNANPPPKRVEVDFSKPIGVTLRKVYIHQIRNGKKTVEGRINSGMFKNIGVGALVRFFYMTAQDDDVYCSVTKVNRYRSFEEMVKTEGYRSCIPDARDEADAIGQYRAIPNYAQKAAQFGVLAFHLQVVEKNR